MTRARRKRPRPRAVHRELALVDALIAQVRADPALPPLRREAAVETLLRKRASLVAEGAR